MIKRKRYVFVTIEGNYVALDHTSGGYPWISDNPLNAHPFSSIDEAKKYQSMFDNTWILKELVGLNLNDV